MGKVSEYMENMYGARLETINRVVVLNAAFPVVVFPNDPNRFAWTLTNVGAAIAYVAFDAAVGAAYGIQLAAVGGWRTSTARDDGELVTRSMYGLGAGATTLYITETRAI